MKRTLSLVLILCAFLCACTGKTEFSESFLCGEAEAYAVCEDRGFPTAEECFFNELMEGARYTITCGPARGIVTTVRPR